MRLVRRIKPDLLLLDLNLGDSDGLALLESVREDAGLADIPVI